MGQKNFLNSLEFYTKSIAISCFIGLILSIYALYIEIRVEREGSYQAMCDINEKISCTKVVTSRYGRGFGIIGPIFGEKSYLNQRNPFIGLFAYIIIALLGYINNTKSAKILLLICILSNFMSLYLAYLLYVLDSLCVICASTYIVNFTNLILAWKRYKLLEKIHVNLKRID